MIERLHRRILNLIRYELEQAGVSDINPARILMLTKIEGREVALRDIIERGCYIVSNALQNIKQLLEADYIAQKRSDHDKRSAKVSLMEKAEDPCRKLVELNEAQAKRLNVDKEPTEKLNTAIDVLQNLENGWSEYFSYG